MKSTEIIGDVKRSIVYESGETISTVSLTVETDLRLVTQCAILTPTAKSMFIASYILFKTKPKYYIII